MLIEAFKSPVQSSDTLPTLVVGGLLALLGVGLLAAAASVPVALVGSEVPATTGVGIGVGLGVVAVPFLLIVMGYLLRVAGAGAREEPVPSFVEWGGLFKGGLAGGVIVLAYLLPAVGFAVAAAAAWAGFWGDAGVLPMSASGRRASLVAGGLLVAGYGVVYTYVTPAALATYGVGGRLRSALWPGTTVRAAASIDYLKSWFVAGFAFLLGLGLVATVIAAPIAFYFLSVVGALLGRGVRGALGVSSTPTDATAADQADGEDGAESGEHGTLADPATVDDMDAETTTVDDGGSASGPGAGPGPADPFEDESTEGSLSSPFDDRDTAGAAPGATAGETSTATGVSADPGDRAQSDDAPDDLDGYQVAEEAEVDRHPDPNAAFAELDLSNGEGAHAGEGDATAGSGGSDGPSADGTAGTGADAGRTETSRSEAEDGSTGESGTGIGTGAAADRREWEGEAKGEAETHSASADPGPGSTSASSPGANGAAGEGTGTDASGGDRSAGTDRTRAGPTTEDAVPTPGSPGEDRDGDGPESDADDPLDGDGSDGNDGTDAEDDEGDGGDGFEWGQIDG